MTDAATALLGMIDAFVSGSDRSLVLAGRMEELIRSAFPDDERFDEALAALARYEPLGGSHFSDARMVSEDLVPLRPLLAPARFVEIGDRWELGVGGKQVDRCAFGFTVELLIDSGDNGWEVALWSPFTIHEAGEVTTHVEPLTGENFAAVLPLLHQEVRSATAYKDGRFTLVFADGARIEAPAGDGFESWTLNGPDRLLVVSLPDGNLSIWRD